MTSPLSRDYMKNTDNIYRKSLSQTKEKPKPKAALQIVIFRNGFFQGEIHNKSFKGPGTLLLFNGMFIVGHFDNGLLNGKAVIFFSQGGTLYCNFMNNQLQGPAVIQFKKLMIQCLRFQKNEVQGETFNYNFAKGRWIKQIYSMGKVIGGETEFKKSQLNCLPVQLKRTQLGKMCQQSLSKAYFFNCLDRSPGIRMGRLQKVEESFYGFLSNNKPMGQGILINKNQTICSNFENKKVSGLTIINFHSDNNILVGKYSDSLPTNQSFLYYFAQNKSLTVKYHGHQETIIETREGFSPLTLFQVSGTNFPTSKVRQDFNLLLPSWINDLFFHYFRIKDASRPENLDFVALKKQNLKLDLKAAEAAQAYNQDDLTFRRVSLSTQKKSEPGANLFNFNTIPQSVNEQPESAREVNQSDIKVRKAHNELDQYDSGIMTHLRQKEQIKSMRNPSRKPILLTQEFKREFMRPSLLGSQVLQLQEEDSHQEREQSDLLNRLKSVLGRRG